MKVTKHQAKDGSLHDTARLCELHNRKLRLAPAMEKFVNTLAADAPGLTNDATVTGSGTLRIDLADLPDFLTAHADQIQAAISNALIIRKPRKAKAAAANDAAQTPAAA